MYEKIMKCQQCKSTQNLFPNSITSKGTIQYLCRKCNTERVKRYRKTKNGAEKIYKAVKDSIKRNPEKQKARLTLYSKIRIGEIIRPKKCEKCGEKKKLFGHHKDYSKPLQVEWVCRECHFLIHKLTPCL